MFSLSDGPDAEDEDSCHLLGSASPTIEGWREMAVVIATAITADGHREVLGLAVGDSKSFGRNPEP
ncbi:hypothetical protein GCM10009733_043000 [Nonomuraea maheshkhaliensis]|uniref:Uncharacterized protein n=1 Tax=Nonomuraea maheshkhaliensis TaxID=419590 RepID=A0ABP4R8L6_9ACTN